MALTERTSDHRESGIGGPRGPERRTNQHRSTLSSLLVRSGAGRERLEREYADLLAVAADTYAELDSDRAEAVAREVAAVEKQLGISRAAWFPNRTALDEFVGVLDDHDTLEWSTLKDGEHRQSTADEFVAGCVTALGPDTADGEDCEHVLFFTLDWSTRALVSPENLARNPEVRVFPAYPDMPRFAQFSIEEFYRGHNCPGLPTLHHAFASAGLDWLDFPMFDPEMAAWLADPQMPDLPKTPELPESAEAGGTVLDAELVEDAAVDVDVDEDEDERNRPLDLRRLRSEPRPPTVYREPGVIPVGRYIGLSGEAGAGKSVLARGMCVAWSLGQSALDASHRFEPAQVVYLDAENGPEWWAEGLDKMDAPLDLPNLRVISYPELAGGLDTERGARSFLALVESLGEVDVLVLDTVSRFVEGGENDSDTWHAVYRLAILPLRRGGIDVLRLDHTGKDAALGARGSSAKMSDLDAHYVLTATAKGSNDLTLKLDKRRQADYDESVRLRRMDAPLRHVRVPDGKLGLRTVNGREVPENERVAALVADLDRLHITYGYGRVRAQEEYAAKGGEIKAGNSVWVDAIKFRGVRADRESEA